MEICSAAPGSIPACAGEPVGMRYYRGVIGVYPRVCGGAVAQGTGVPIGKGLSPRVRGSPSACATTAAL